MQSEFTMVETISQSIEKVSQICGSLYDNEIEDCCL